MKREEEREKIYERVGRERSKGRIQRGRHFFKMLSRVKREKNGRDTILKKREKKAKKKEKNEKRGTKKKRRKKTRENEEKQ